MKMKQLNKMNSKISSSAGRPSVIYGMSVVGALVYFLQQASGVWMGLFGILKALIWPAILVYHLLGFLKV